MPSIRSFAFFDGVTETDVPAQTRTSPPRDNFNTVVLLPAVREDPAANSRSATTTSPAPPVTGTIAGAASGVNDTTCGSSNGDFLLVASASVFESPGGFSRN